jgi:hypothetical protein
MPDIDRSHSISPLALQRLHQAMVLDRDARLRIQVEPSFGVRVADEWLNLEFSEDWMVEAYKSRYRPLRNIPANVNTSFLSARRLDGGELVVETEIRMIVASTKDDYIFFGSVDKESQNIAAGSWSGQPIGGFKSLALSGEQCLILGLIQHEIYAWGMRQCNALLLHANLVEVNGCGVLLVGGNGTGKSTLSAEFANLGHAVLADDFVVLKDRKAFPNTRVLELLHESFSTDVVVFDSPAIQPDFKQDSVTISEIFFMSGFGQAPVITELSTAQTDTLLRESLLCKSLLRREEMALSSESLFGRVRAHSLRCGEGGCTAEHLIQKLERD